MEEFDIVGSKSQAAVVMTTATLVSEAQRSEPAPLPDVGFSDGVTRRLKVAHERLFGQDIGYWFCDVGYQLDVDMTGVNLSGLSLDWYTPDTDGGTNGFEVTLEFENNEDVIVGRGRAEVSECGFHVTNRLLAVHLDPTVSVPVPLSADVRFQVDVESLVVVGRGRPRIVNGQPELIWTVEAEAEGVQVHDTVLPYVSTLDTLLSWLPRAGVELADAALISTPWTFPADLLTTLRRPPRQERG